MSKCEHCDSATVNGVFCHEYDCPNKKLCSCDGCGENVTKLTGEYVNNDSQWSGNRYCSESCATNDTADHRPANW